MKSNGADKEAVDHSLEYAALLIEYFKSIDANPVEALTGAIVFVASTACGIGVPQGAIKGIVNDTLTDVYSSAGR